MLRAMAGVLQEVAIAGPAAGASLGGFVSGVAALAAAHPGVQAGQLPPAAAGEAAAAALRSAMMHQAAGLIRGLHEELERSKEQVGGPPLLAGLGATALEPSSHPAMACLKTLVTRARTRAGQLTVMPACQFLAGGQAGCGAVAHGRQCHARAGTS